LPSGAINYLSGLLIGDELRASPKGAQPVLIGDAALCHRYQQAMRLCGIAAQPGPEMAVAAGLFRIARHEGKS
jgi:2-dehydro-3-deoxygalactonokinase